MKKIFLSLPFNGRTNKEIHIEIKKMIDKYCLEHDITPSMVVNGEVVFVNNYDARSDITIEQLSKCKHNRLLYLGEAIKLMAECDEVIFSENYEKAKGCKVEKTVYDLYFCH